MSYDINNILRKVLLGSNTIGNEELEKYLAASIKLNTEEIMVLLLDIQNKVTEDEFKRILTYIPASHQEYILILLKCGAQTDTKLQKLNQAYVDMKTELVNEITYRYIVDTSLGKEDFKKFIALLPNAKRALALEGLKEEKTEKTEINIECIDVIESIEQAKKVI